MRTYEVEFMGVDGKDMYDMTINAKDIDTALKVALGKKDRNDDRIVSIIEEM